MPRLASEDVVAFVGKRGSGKSTRAKELAAGLRRSGQRVVVFDVHDEYSRAGHGTRQVRLGALTQRATLDELLSHPRRTLDREDLALAVVPPVDPENVRSLADALADVLTLVYATGDLVFIVEEVGAFSAHAQGSLNFLGTQSRHAAMPVVFVAQRMVQIPATARSQLSRLNSGRQDHPADLRALSDVGGPEFASRVTTLGRGDFVEWRDTWSRREEKRHG